MPAPSTLTAAHLMRLIGTHDAPAIIDVRNDPERSAEPFLVPGAVRRDAGQMEVWAAPLAGRAAVVVCADGGLSAGVAAWLRHAGIAAEVLEGGMAAWRGARGPLLNASAVPPPDARGRTVWVTRGAAESGPGRLPLADPAVRRSRRGVPVRGAGGGGGHGRAIWRHAVRHRGLLLEPPRRAMHLRRHDPGVRAGGCRGGCRGSRSSCAGRIRRGWTWRRSARGCWRRRSGFSRMFRDDLAQLEVGLSLYDAFWRWSRDALAETHTWPGPARGEKAAAEPAV